MKRKLFLSIFVTGLLANNVALQAKVECVRFEYGKMPVALAKMPAIAKDLQKKNRTILYEYKLGADMTIGSFIILVPLLIAGAVYLDNARNAFKRYCRSRLCLCTGTRAATLEDFRLTE